MLYYRFDIQFKNRVQVFKKKDSKEDDETKDIPVVIFSSLVNDEMKRKGEALGANAQLSKPEIGNLVRIIDELVL